ncbi:MAG: hypothetical protein ACI95C_000183 [Pseudohongiellaceae bacterium]|jgi:hypothetical protein
MAEAEETGEEATTEDVVESLQSRSKAQLIVLFGACASTVVLLACLGFTYISLSGQILSATAEPLMEMKNLSGLVKDEYSNLNMAVEFYNLQMTTIGTRLDGIDPTVDQEQFEELRKILISQEQDFQVFLNSSKNAMTGLSKMLSGSRSWRDDFNSKLDLAITTSAARELTLNATDNAEAAPSADQTNAASP